MRRAESDAEDARRGADRRGRPSGCRSGAARRSIPTADVVTYLAYLDGEPVARATGSFSEHGVTLFGGATLPEHARGRGVLPRARAARWRGRGRARDAGGLSRRRGAQSRPILARLGFREVCDDLVTLDLTWLDGVRYRRQPTRSRRRPA